MNIGMTKCGLRPSFSEPKPILVEAWGQGLDFHLFFIFLIVVNLKWINNQQVVIINNELKKLNILK